MTLHAGVKRFSIITVTKDDAVGLEATRRSVEGQNFTDFEWIIQDGNQVRDAGIYDAMNKGIERASGDYIIFLNGGDAFASSHTLSSIVKYGAQSQADFIYGDALEGGHIKRARHDIARGMITHHQAMCYRRGVMGDLRYDTRYKIAADYKFTAQFLKRAKSVAYIPCPICIFEMGGVSQRHTKLGRREQHAIRCDLKLCPTFLAWGIYVRQAIAQVLRDCCPALYWRLKQRLN